MSEGQTVENTELEMNLPEVDAVVAAASDGNQSDEMLKESGESEPKDESVTTPLVEEEEQNSETNENDSGKVDSTQSVDMSEDKQTEMDKPQMMDASEAPERTKSDGENTDLTVERDVAEDEKHKDAEFPVVGKSVQNQIEADDAQMEDVSNEQEKMSNDGKNTDVSAEDDAAENEKESKHTVETSTTGQDEAEQTEAGDIQMEDIENTKERESDNNSAKQSADNDASEPAATSNVERSEEKRTEMEDAQMEDVKDVQEKTDGDKITVCASEKKLESSSPTLETPAEIEPKKPVTVPVTTPTEKTLAPAPSSVTPSTTAATSIPHTTTISNQPTLQPQTTAQQQQNPSSLQPPQLIMPGALPPAQNLMLNSSRGRPLSSVGVPAAKRARVNGTLDAGIPISAPDLSDATLQRYKQAANEIGVHLIATPAGTPRSNDRRQEFLDDHTRYMASLGKTDYKIRTIGGNKLDLFTLYYSVLQRGGVQNVISTRTFRLVGKALNLPKSCTSAAYILRVDYEKLLYAYEQKHVWGRDEDEIPPLHSTDRVKGNPGNSTPSTGRTIQRTRIPAIHTPQHATAHATTPGVTTRPKRQAALAASSAVAAAAASDDDDDEPGMELRTRTMGIDMNSLTPHQEAIVAEEVNANAPHSVFNPNAPGERERVIQALWSANSEDLAFALGTFNALSFDNRNNFQARHFPGLLDALCAIMQRHVEDVEKRRRFGLPFNYDGPQVVSMAAMDVRDAGVSNGALDEEDRLGSGGKVSSLQEYGDLFNCVDNIAVDREQCAVVAVNILRNMSFDEPNAMTLATSQVVMDLAAEMLLNANVPGNLRDGLIDMWINVSSYLHVAKGQPGHPVLITCVKLLNPFLEGAEYSRFTNCGEILARLAASPERNESAFVEVFPELLPRLVDMIGGKDRRYVNAGLAALCNCSAFDWPARSRIARVPRCMPRLVNMLTDPELAPRAALTLLNLAEAHSNRSVILAYEKQLVEQAIKVSPASDTVASILFDLSND